MSKSLPEERWRFAVPGGGKAAVEARREARLRLIEEGLSRRRFLHVSAGTTGLVLAGGAWSRGFAATCEPQPIPHTLDPGGGLPPIHILLPGLAHPADADPSTITDFNGQVGYAIIDGTGTRTDLVTTEVRRPVRGRPALHEGRVRRCRRPTLSRRVRPNMTGRLRDPGWV